MASPGDLTPSSLIPQFPDDLSIHCIARVPRSHHPKLALVSHAWHSLLRSPLLFTLRSDLAATERTLYINIRTPTNLSRWYVLHRRPARLLPLPPTPTPSLGSASATLNPHLYVLGGSLSNVPSSVVQIFDPRFNSWAPGPEMIAPRQMAAAGVLGGSVYIVGGCLPPSESDSWAETLDASGVWVPVPSPAHLRTKWMHGSAVVGERLIAVGGSCGVVLDPEAAIPWVAVSEALHAGWRGREAVVDGILYSHNTGGKLIGYDGAMDVWKAVEGVERELPEFLYGATMANMGGLLCLVWKGSGRGVVSETEISCVGIKVNRTGCGGFWGSIAWKETLLVPISDVRLLGSVALEF